MLRIQLNHRGNLYMMINKILQYFHNFFLYVIRGIYEYKLRKMATAILLLSILVKFLPWFETAVNVLSDFRRALKKSVQALTVVVGETEGLGDFSSILCTSTSSDLAV